MRWLVVLILACRASEPPPSVRFADAVVPDAAPPVRARTTTTTLSSLGVTDDDFYRPVLYTWTTADSIARLRESRQLLVATTTSGGFVSPYLRALFQLARRGGDGHDLAQILLTNDQLSRRRYAWPAPFATVLGLGPRTYGRELVRVELRADAWIGRFEPGAKVPFRFVDARNGEVAIADVVAHPERIGAMFHVQRGAAIPFREYVICNPAMVASWQVATPAIADELAAERAIIDGAANVTEISSAATPDWQHGSPASWIHQWHAALAFDNARYHPTAKTLTELSETLVAPTGEPLTGH